MIPLSDQLKKWRAQRPDEWRMDEFIKEAEHLENTLFVLGAMNNAPCFCCGYNGVGYYQPDIHKCAERHHALYKK